MMGTTPSKTPTSRFKLQHETQVKISPFRENDPEQWSNRTGCITKQEHKLHCTAAEGFVKEICDNAVEIALKKKKESAMDDWQFENLANLDSPETKTKKTKDMKNKRRLRQSIFANFDPLAEMENDKDSQKESPNTSNLEDLTNDLEVFNTNSQEQDFNNNNTINLINDEIVNDNFDFTERNVSKDINNDNNDDLQLISISNICNDDDNTKESITLLYGMSGNDNGSKENNDSFSVLESTTNKKSINNNDIIKILDTPAVPLLSPRSRPKHTERDIEKLKAEHNRELEKLKVELAAREKDTRSSRRECDILQNETERLTDDLIKQQEKESKLLHMMAEYENSITKLLGKNEEVQKKLHDYQHNQIGGESEQVNKELLQTQEAFHELRKRYERLKGAHENATKNIETLKESNASYLNSWRLAEERNETIQSQVDQKLNDKSYQLLKIEQQVSEVKSEREKAEAKVKKLQKIINLKDQELAEYKS